MGIKYDGLKLVWLKQFGSDQTLVSWVSPEEGDIGSFTGGYKPIIPSVVRVINGRSPIFTLTSGSLPTGLSLNANTGAITGTLNNTDGSYSYTLRATSGLVYAERSFSANVAANQAPVWITNAGSLGQAYDSSEIELQLEAEDPEAQPIKFQIVAGSLPSGLLLGANSGLISGVLNPVTDDTTFFFTLSASDGVQATNRAFNYTTLKASPPVWVTPAGLIGTQTEQFNFSYTLNAVVSLNTVSYSIISGELPGGVTLDANTGLINGTVNAVGVDTNYNFSVRATDGIKSTNRNFTIKVLKDVAPVWVSSGSLGQGFGGQPFNSAVIANDPNGQPVTYAMANGSSLPGDLVLANNGTISGTLPTPVNTTNYNFSIVANDGHLTAVRSFSINVLLNEAPVWDTGNALVDVIEEMYFVRQVQAHDPAGVQPITYSFVSGTIPSGVNFYANGVLSGTPLSVVSDTDYVFVIEANNGVLSSTREFTLPVDNNTPPVWTTNAGLINTVQGLSNYEYQLSAADPNGTVPVYTLQSGSLPGGLSLSSGGRISGIVANVASTTQYDFTVSASDGYNGPVNRMFAISVTKNERPVWVTNSGVLGGAFESAPLTVQVNGYDPEGAPVRYYLAEGNNLPNGMFLNQSTGVITGTVPHVEQDTVATFDLYIDDGTYGNVSKTRRTFSLNLLFNSPPVWVTPADLGNKVESKHYSLQLSATGVGNGPMIYSLDSGTLPAGISLSSAGLLSGILPAAASDTDYTFTVKAYNGIKFTTREFTLTVEHNLAPVWSTNSGVIASALGNVNFSVQLSAVDPNAEVVTYALTNATTLPAGVTMTAAGLVSGKMAIVANSVQFNFDVRASDGVLSSDRSFSLITLAQANPTWITAAGEIASVFKSTYYSGYVQAVDPQNLSITYSIVSGALPTGLSLNANSGLIAGITPNVTDDTVSNFTIRASNGNKFVDRAFSFEVTAVSAPTWVTPAGSVGSVLSGYGGAFGFSATDAQSIPLTYSFVSGTIPPGMTFQGGGSASVFTSENATVPVTSTDTVYSFTLEVTNGFVPVQRSFSITVLKNLAPVWVSPASGALGNSVESAPVSITFVATDPEEVGIYYVLNSGAFPAGLSLNPNTGVLAGNAGTVANTTTYNFVVDARDGVLRTPRSFSYQILFSSPPIWSTASGSLGSALEQSQFSANVVATSDGQPITYSLANGTNLPGDLVLDNATGQISGLLPPVVNDTTYNFTLAATSTVSNKSTNRNFSIGVINDLPPVWSTPAGSLESDLAGTIFSKSLLAIDPNGTPITYVLANGVMPEGVNFDPNGVGGTATVSGTLPIVNTNTTYNFTVGAMDGVSQVNRAFSFTSQLDLAPAWTTNAGLIGTGTEGQTFNYILVATDPNGKTVTYSLDNGSALPGSLTLNTANGRIFGTLPTANANAQITDNYAFNVSASDGTQANSRTFSIGVAADQVPVWVTASGSIGSVIEGQTFTFQLSATDPEGQPITYTLANSTTLPNGIILYSNGSVRGRPSAISQDTVFPFTARASDGVKFTDRNFDMSVLFDSTFYDPFSNSVTLLMNFEDPIGTNAITDWFEHSLSVTGNAVVSNAHVQYGNSAYFNQGTGEVVTNRLPDFDFMNKANWTVEAWVYPVDNITNGWVAAESPLSENTPNSHWTIKKVGAAYQYKYGTGNVVVALGNVTVDAWQHIAVSRQGSTVRTFNNGQLIATGSQSTIANVAGNLEIGLNLEGFIDDFRVTEVTRYTSTFTPGPAPKPPKWITASNAIVIDGTEGYALANANVIALQITDQSGKGVRNYNTINGTTSSVSLDIANGTFTGTVPQAMASGNYILNVQGKDGNNNLTSIRPFQFRSNALSVPSELRFSWRFNNQIGSSAFGPLVGNATMTKTGTITYEAGAAPNQGTMVANFAITSGPTYGILSNATTGTQMNFLASNQWTWETWIYSPVTLASVGGNRRLFSVGGATGGLKGNALNVLSTGSALIAAYLNNYAAGQATFPATVAGQWNHLALVRNGDTLTAYTNGVAGTPGTGFTGLPASPTYFDNEGFKINEFYDQSSFSFTTPFSLHGFNFWSTAKYTGNFVPQWDNYLTPIWTTNSGIITTAYETANFAVSVNSKSFGNTAVTYSANATLPASMTLVSNGYVYGTVPAFGDTANSFSLTITDANGYKSSTRSFIVNAINASPVWISNGLVGSNISNATVTLQLNTTDPLGATPVTYTLNSGSLPGGLTLLSNGLITGVLNMQSVDTTSTFTVNAVNTTGKFSRSNNLTFTQYTDTDPNFANTIVMLHADGNFTNIGNSSLTFSAGGTSGVQNSVVKFGTGAFNIAGSPTNYIRSSGVPTIHNLGARSFTIECWINVSGFVQNLGPPAGTYQSCLMFFGMPTTGVGNQGNAWGVFISGTGPSSQIISMGASGWNSAGSGQLAGLGNNLPGGPANLNQWYHVVSQRDGNVFSLYFDGQLVAQTTAAVTLAPNFNTGYVWNLGTLSSTGNYEYPFNGRIDDFRVTMDVARYSGGSTITVPNKAFPSIGPIAPVFANAANLGAGLERDRLTKLIVANASTANSTPISYSLVSGALPGTATLLSNGLITGMTSDVSIDTIDTFTIRATDTQTRVTDRTFTYTTYANSDVYYNNVSVLLHAEDTPNGGVLAEATGLNNTFTLGSAVVSNAAAKFGNSSLLSNGTISGANLAQTAANPAGLNFGQNDFTIETWFNANAMANTGGFRGAIASLNSRNPTATNLALNWTLSLAGPTANTINQIQFYTGSGANAATTDLFANLSVPIDTWHHLAVTRRGTTLRMFLNGVLANSVTNASVTNYTMTAGNSLQLGGTTVSGFSSNLRGYIDELRITNGVARYVDNFTVTTGAFPNIQDPTPVWYGNTTVIAISNTVANYALQVASPRTGTMTYTLANGALPNGTVLTGDGRISGQLDNVANITNSVFTITAADAFAPSYMSNQTITYSVQPYVDQFAANVITLMPMTGTAGTLPVDLKGRPVSKDTAGFQGSTGTSGVGGLISATQSKWGGGSMFISQKASSLLIVGNATTLASDFIQTNVDFCIEFWHYPTGSFAAPPNMLWSTYNTSGYYLNINASGNLEWRDSGGVVFTTSGGALTQNQWYHIAVTRTGTTFRIFIDGIQRATGSWSGALGTGQGTTGFVLGHYQSSPNSAYGAIGYFSDYRMTKGVARYTSNFTPPIGPIA